MLSIDLLVPNVYICTLGMRAIDNVGEIVTAPRCGNYGTELILIHIFHNIDRIFSRIE